MAKRLVVRGSGTGRRLAADVLGEAHRALAVIAHPDDESFGLGAVLSVLAGAGAELAVLCFTHGEASTLGPAVSDGSELREVRAGELADAAGRLGVSRVELHDYADGHLTDCSLDELADLVSDAARRWEADLLIVFDEGGITGHPDHEQATRAALAAAARLDVAVVAWAVSQPVATALNEELGTGFIGRTADEIDLDIEVDRSAQLAAIACHVSQSVGNPVLWRRLELTAEREPLRLLRPARTVDHRCS